MPASQPVNRLIEKFVEQDPKAAARHLEKLSEPEAAAVVAELPSKHAALVFPHLQVSFAAVLLSGLDLQKMSALLGALELNRAATIFMHLGEDARQRFLPHIPEKLRIEIRDLATYPEHSVGRLMSTGFLSFKPDATIRDTIKKIRSAAAKQYHVSYGYVVDIDNRLVGVINMRDLMLGEGTQTLEAIMRKDVFTVHCFADVSEAANEIAKRRYFGAPVVDDEGHILGVVKAEQLIHGAQEGIAESILKMVGVGGNERTFSPIRYSLKKRIPWLHVNLLTAFMAAAVVAFFEDTIAKITVLAVFLPVVAGQGGNAGAQSLAIVMRGLVMREIPKNRIRYLILKEGLIGTVTGLVTGSVTAILAWLWYGNPYLGLVIGLGMVVNLFCAGLAGASIPIGMKALRLDPAQCSSIILTTVTDVVGFFAFLGFAVLFQDQLV